MEDQPASRGAEVKPSAGEAVRLHRKYGSSEQVIRHCVTVADVAWTLAEEMRRRGKEVDAESLYTAALLHDIGRSRTQTVRHGLEGSEIVKSEGMPDAVVEIVRRHVGAGISREEAKSLGLPDLDYIPRSPEEVIVCFSDKMVDGERVRPFEEEVKRFEKKGHDVGRLRALKRRVEEEVGCEPEALLLDKIKGASQTVSD